MGIPNPDASGLAGGFPNVSGQSYLFPLLRLGEGGLGMRARNYVTLLF